MSSQDKIAELKRQLGETVQRIDTIQQGRQLPLTSRIARHFKTQSGSLINVVLTASVLAVALGKWQQKQQYQVQKNSCPLKALPLHVTQCSMCNPVLPAALTVLRARSKSGKNKGKGYNVTTTGEACLGCDSCAVQVGSPAICSAVTQI